MSYYKKYLKYKNKYLELKKQLGGRRIRTIPNSGALEGMTNQCFWISILNYLQRNGHPALTLRQLRTNAGLGADTEHTMFDIDHRDRHGHVDDIFYNAAMRIANLYNLRIQVHTVDHTGEILGQRAHIGDGANFFEIAQFGLAHFELINGVGGAFVPAVIVKGNLTKDINPEMKPRYLQLNEQQGFLKILEEQLREDHKRYDESLKEKATIQSSNAYTGEEKAEFLTSIDKFTNRLVSDIGAKEKKIEQLKQDISSLILIISEFEKN
jgi:hypothetical protein